MRRIFSVVFLIIIALAFVLKADCATDKPGQEFKLYMGEPKIIPVTNPTRIAIGNPNIIDVVNVSKSEITLSPKAPGSTTLVFWDIFGEQNYTVRVFSEDMNDIKRRVDNMLEKVDLPGVTTQAEEEEGKVLLLGKVGSAQDREKISMVLGGLKDKTIDLTEIKEESTVIEIDVQVLELNKGATDTLGFTWPGSVNIYEVGSPGLAAAGTSWGKLFKLSDVQRAIGGTADPYTLKLDALIQEGKARILSRPRLSCQSGKEAKLIVGGEVPIFTATQSASGVTGNVEYKEYGIILNIKPKADEKERIHINLGIEVSEIGTTAESTSYARAYPLTKRNAYTELYLNNGQTMAIGGLIKQKSEEDLRRVPWLSNVPVLGAFFRTRTTKSGSGFSTKGDTELFITLTPRIISEQTKAVQERKIEPKVISPEIVAGTNVPDPVAGYASIVQKRIVDNVIYPNAAQEAGFQGITKLSLLLSYRGEPKDIKIKSSSGYKILDDSALAAAQKIVSYPPFPSSIEQKELWLDIPVSYQLN